MALPSEILGFAAEIVEHLRQRGETISTAESLTAGAVSSALVTISGASDVFVGGLTAYRDEIKTSHLGIDPELIESIQLSAKKLRSRWQKARLNPLEQPGLSAPLGWPVLIR